MDTFSQANVGPEMGTEIVQALGLNALELQKPDVYARFSDIVSYMKNFSDAPLMIHRLSRNTLPQERLAKVHEYIGLRKALDGVRAELRDLPMSDMITGNTPEMRAKREELSTKETLLLSEISYYE